MKKNLYEWVEFDSFENRIAFRRFINWIIGEFDLYLKEELSELVVYFPRGYFTISEQENNNVDIKFKISIYSKSLKKGNYIKEKIDGILYHSKSTLNLKNKSQLLELNI
ncbi:hypothetical protein GCM10007962_30740 [Yeosuana aromativorans]|uniref:Uncharacterized protein n=1 Tax=Yeosuana aromativorans TaxID=288019 RepID=A0A8J3BTQ6_9FLAO|nr:hypothetical protein [Yeosuana aromativorans]GGK34164.1 hypothetical protein GCM10007962_30740 [Yeosuana aromativorans]